MNLSKKTKVNIQKSSNINNFNEQSIALDNLNEKNQAEQISENLLNNVNLLAIIQNNQTIDEDFTAQKPDSALYCLELMAHFHQVVVDVAQIAHQHRAFETMSLAELMLAFKSIDLHTSIKKINFNRLNYINLPAIACEKTGEFFIVAGITQNQVLVQYPDERGIQNLSIPEFNDNSDGEMILVASRASTLKELARFDFTWFIPSIIKYRKLLLEILFVSLIIQGFALVTPLFFQTVMDKVLVHRGLETLDVVAIGLLVISIFSIILTALRSYIFSHTTSRIDAELGAKLFKHLLSLPVIYFQSRRVGDSVARVHELENIRSFLTGNAITIILDILFSVIFLICMFFYSKLLTLIVVISLPIYLATSLLITPALRRALNEKFYKSAENQSFLVETIHGIDTIKAMSVEPHWLRKWEMQLASYIQSSFKTSNIALLMNSLVGLIDKLVIVAIMYFGAKLVIEGKLSVGQLIAFNMLSGQVSQPVVRLAQLWTEFQQIGISIQRLGDILNSKTEIHQHKAFIPSIEGKIELEDIHFRYQPTSAMILKNIHLSIHPGEVIGVVGRSGSGKSTLTKLVQRLYIPEQGKIKIDDLDISGIDPSSLRRQIGVVLQENMLFNRSIRDNIALNKSTASIQEVIESAKLAGAHEFISEFKDGYDTIIEEQGRNLSGGQRQRLAIARALITQPKILIFDEATSALDYESEYIIQKNMHAICQGRTVIIIAHRLSAVRQANRIIVLERGEIIEQGCHTELLAKNGHYAYLHQLQQH